jgi:Uncharacterized protein conserved in bacteria
MSKDSDFLVLLDRFGPPPQILWITCGNTSNARLKEVLTVSLPKALDLLRLGEPPITSILVGVRVFMWIPASSRA